MCFGGNSRAHIFFKQHGWTDGGKIEAKYTSRAAELYRQILAKEVAKSSVDESSLPSSPAHSPKASDRFSDASISEAQKESLAQKETPELPASPRAPSLITSTVKKPLGAKKTGKTGGLGARKLTKKVG